MATPFCSLCLSQRGHNAYNNSTSWTQIIIITIAQIRWPYSFFFFIARLSPIYRARAKSQSSTISSRKEEALDRPYMTDSLSIHKKKKRPLPLSLSLLVLFRFSLCYLYQLM
ncbi:MAG: hypothetical protein J3R72DRAFT_94343 [Linnemannia gamsii]|nr:MAG: hypothetical protein J3R72DRAFT_94343 [Linnemannia gamsii]